MSMEEVRWKAVFPGIEVTSSILQCKFPPFSAKSVHPSVNLSGWSCGECVASPELANVGHGWFAVERELTDGDEVVVFKHLARGRIVQCDPRAQPAESVLGGGELAHLAHRRCGQPLPRDLLRDPVSQLRRPVCHFGQV